MQNPLSEKFKLRSYIGMGNVQNRALKRFGLIAWSELSYFQYAQFF